MPYAMVPTGYRAVLIGQTLTFHELGTFAPLEESSAEGALFLARLDFESSPPAESLDQLEQAFQDAGVEHWPGYEHVVYADVSAPAIYLAWQKGIAWLPVIIGLVLTVALPPLVGSLIWWLLPEDIKNLISSFIDLGMMLIVLVVMIQIMKPLTAQEQPKKVAEARK
jgi:hypothetical protein